MDLCSLQLSTRTLPFELRHHSQFRKAGKLFLLNTYWGAVLKDGCAVVAERP